MLQPLGKGCLHETTKNNGVRSVDCAAYKNLIMKNTLFPPTPPDI